LALPALADAVPLNVGDVLDVKPAEQILTQPNHPMDQSRVTGPTASSTAGPYPTIGGSQLDTVSVSSLGSHELTAGGSAFAAQLNRFTQPPSVAPTNTLSMGSKRDYGRDDESSHNPQPRKYHEVDESEE